MKSDIDNLNTLWDSPESDKKERLEDLKYNYRNRLNKVNNVFCGFEIYYSPTDIIDGCTAKSVFHAK